MDSLEFSLLLVMSVLAVVSSQVQMDQQHVQPPATQLPPHIENRLKDKAHVSDREHIKEHLDRVAKLPEEMTDDELQFHYFKVHDYDNNNMLDGIELTSAVTHFHKDDSHSSDGSEDVLQESEIESLVDTILEDEDHNIDGYIDYGEFILSQRGEANFD